MKTKFKVYPWLGTERRKKGYKKHGIYHLSFWLFPSIELDRWLYKDGGGWFTLQFIWLIFGVTFDWRREEE